MKRNLIFLVAIALATIISCGQQQDLIAYMADDFTMERAVSPRQVKVADDAGNQDVIDRKIIKEGEINFQTNNAGQTRELIASSIQEFDGYISRDNVYDYDNKTEHRITVRIPAVHFDTLLERISRSAGKIDSKNIHATDVTTEFIDVEARLSTKKELESRYIELLKMANKVEEILAIEREIGILRSEIESIEGRLKYLTDRVSFSTLTIVFYEKAGTSFGFVNKMGQGFKNGWNNLLWVFVALVNIWPFILLFVLLVMGLRRLTKRKMQKTQ